MSAEDPQAQALADTVRFFDDIITELQRLVSLERDLRVRAYMVERHALMRAARDAVFDDARHRRPLDLHVPGQLSLDDEGR